MAERKRQWTLLKDLRPERPMFLFETGTLESYVGESELACQDPQLRVWERHMRETLRHAEEVGDDLVVEPWLALHWDVEQSDYGVPIEISRGVDTEGGSQGYHYNHPLKTPSDASRLRPRTRRVCRDRTLALKDRLQGLFGDLLPVEVRGIGSPLAAITSDLFRLIGNDNLLTWPYDAPDVLRGIVAYLRDDRLEHYRWLEEEGLLAPNNDSHLVGSGSPGFTTSLPSRDTTARPGREAAGPTRLRDLWAWIESQETTMISPPMFADFFLPGNGGRGGAVRPGVLRLLRAGTRSVPADRGGHPPYPSRVRLSLVPAGGHCRYAGTDPGLLPQAQAVAPERPARRLGRDREGPGRNPSSGPRRLFGDHLPRCVSYRRGPAAPQAMGGPHPRQGGRSGLVAGGTRVKYVVIGASTGATMEALMAVYPRHKAIVDQYVAKGVVIGIGPFSDRGNMAIFRTREAAEEFARIDPFMLEGLVKEYVVREWNDSLIP